MLQLLVLAASTIRIVFTLLLRMSTCSNRKNSLKILSSKENFLVHFVLETCCYMLAKSRNSPLAISSERLCTCWPSQKSAATPPTPSCWATRDGQWGQCSHLAGLCSCLQQGTAAPSCLSPHRTGASPLLLHHFTCGTALTMGGATVLEALLYSILFPSAFLLI